MSNPVVIAELRRIADANRGQLRPIDVVNAARPKASPLHSRFEWDNTKAAQEYRLWQARHLINVTVEYFGGEESSFTGRVFVSLTSDRGDGAGYRSMVSVMSDDQHRARLMQDALEEMDVFKRKYIRLKELADVFVAMSKVKRRREKVSA